MLLLIKKYSFKDAFKPYFVIFNFTYAQKVYLNMAKYVSSGRYESKILPKPLWGYIYALYSVLIYIKTLQKSMQKPYFSLEESEQIQINQKQRQKFLRFQQLYLDLQNCDIGEHQEHHLPGSIKCQSIQQVQKSQESQTNKATVHNPQSKQISKQATKGKGKLDYKKNICGHITRKAMRELVSTKSRKEVQQLCNKNRCSFEEVRGYCLATFEKVTGPTHVFDLLTPKNEEQRPVKRVFGEFFLWFLKERYIRYMLLEGKMEMKNAYLKYKNTKLIQMIQCIMEDAEVEFSPIVKIE